MLADMVRTDSHQLRPAAGDSPQAGGIKVLARTHKTLIWERSRAVQRLRHQLREYFPAALEAFEDLDAPDALELLGKAPEPARAARLTRAPEFELVLERVIDAPRARVFDAWAKSEKVAKWFAPRPLTLEVVRMDFRSGGGFQMADIRLNRADQAWAIPPGP